MKKIKSVLVKLVYIIILLLTIMILVRKFNNDDIKNIILCVVAIFLYLIPLCINKLFKNMFPTIIRIVLVLFVFSTIILGEVNDFYELVPIWDDILHIVQGFFIGWIGFIISFRLFKDNAINKEKVGHYKIFIILFSICLSISIGTIWEMLEYTVDCNMNVDMQKDNYIYRFNSILLNPKKDNEIMKIDKIGYTSIYDEYGNKIITFNGYLDVGNMDTMTDLIDTFVGCLVFCVAGIIYLNDNNNNNNNNKYV